MSAAKRLLPLLRVALPALLVLALLNGALLSADRLPAEGLLPIDPTLRSSGKWALNVERRVSRAELELRLGGRWRERPLCVIYGTSTVGEGFDLATLYREDGIDARYLHLAGTGQCMTEFTRSLQPLLTSGLKPDLVVLGIHPFFLVDLPDKPAQLGVFDAKWAQRQTGDSRQAGRPQSPFWIGRRRADMAVLTDFYLNEARRALCVESAGEESVWGQGYPIKTLKILKERDIRLLAEGLGEKGKFDLELYRRYGRDSMELLAGCIAPMQARGSKVVVLIMPERGQVRASIPSEARSLLTESLKKLFPDGSVAVLDLGDALPDSEFRDHVHPSEAGRLRLSRLLAREVPGLLEGSSPTSPPDPEDRRAAAKAGAVDAGRFGGGIQPAETDGGEA